MEEIDRLRGDFELEHALAGLTKLTESIPRVQDKLRILEAALSQVATGDVSEGDVPEVSYGYIPLDLAEFFEAIFDLEKALSTDPDYKDNDIRHRRVDFVEAGCGSARNLYLLGVTDRFEFGKLHGFDLSEPLIEHGRNVFGLGDTIFTGDCNTFDFSPYDVIYFYRPFSDSDAQRAFENKLVDQLKPGAYIIGCGHLSFDEDRRLISKCEQNRLFKKLR